MAKEVADSIKAGLEEAIEIQKTRRKTVKQVDAEQNKDEARIIELERKVAILWEMVVFLSDNPHYRVGDYLMERGISA